MKILDGGRISIAALALGMARGAYDAALAYAAAAQQFGQPIAEFQAIQFMLAEMATRDRRRRAPDLPRGVDEGPGQQDRPSESSMAKLYASEIGRAASPTGRCRSSAATAT